MEPLRPLVDAAVLDLLSKPLQRKWFAEHESGQCYITTPFCRALAALALWQPYANDCASHIAKALEHSIPRATNRPKRGRDLKKRRS